MKSSYCIVLIEDSREDIYLVREALAAAEIPCELHVIEDGGKASFTLSQIGEELRQPDLFLVDLNLPKADGFQIISFIKQHPSCRETPVIVMSSSDSQRERDRALAVGVAHYFCKPLDLDEFMKLGGIVQSILEASPTI